MANLHEASDAQKRFDEQYQKQTDGLRKPTILVCGYTGIGKTSLIRAVCGNDIVPEEKIGHGKPMTQAFESYSNGFINLWDSKGFEPGDREKDFIAAAAKFVRQVQESQDAANHIHLVWYCIQGPGARVTAADLKLSCEIFSRKNEIFVITKNDITKERQRDAITAELTANGIPGRQIVACDEGNAASLKKLIDLSLEMLPSAYHDAFINGQLVDLDKKADKAHLVIHGAATSAATAAGLNPLPISDAVVITPIQIGMIASLAAIYRLPAAGVKALVAPVLAEAIGVATAGSLAKLFPGIGQVIQSGVAFAVTEALGFCVMKYLHACCEASIAGVPPPAFDQFSNLAEAIRMNQGKKRA